MAKKLDDVRKENGANEADKVKEERYGIVEGHTYHLAGYYWIAAEVKDGYAVLQSTGVTSGPWPGYKMSQFGGTDNFYRLDIDGINISDYDAKMSALYETIKAFEFTNTKYGNGLFLISKAKVRKTSQELVEPDNYWSALKTAASNHIALGIHNNSAWLGTAYTDYVWCVGSNGNVDDNVASQVTSCVVAPAFNLDITKVEVEGNEIVII